MNDSLSRHRLWIFLFLIAVLSFGTGLCYWQMQKKVDNDIHARLQQAIASLDVTVSHPEQAANMAELSATRRVPAHDFWVTSAAWSRAAWV